MPRLRREIDLASRLPRLKKSSHEMGSPFRSSRPDHPSAFFAGNGKGCRIMGCPDDGLDGREPPGPCLSGREARVVARALGKGRGRDADYLGRISRTLAAQSNATSSMGSAFQLNRL